VDPDHGAGGIDVARRGQHADPNAFPPYGEVFPNGIAGARSNGSGYVIKDPAVVAAAHDRAVAALGSATPGIPALGSAGTLPVGVHAAAWDDFQARFVTTPRRSELAGQLGPVLDALRGAGIPNAVIGGSYVTSKPAPGDVDLGYFAPTSDAARAARTALAALVERSPDVHAYPVDALLPEAPTLGVRPGSNVLEFLQQGRDHAPRGVVLLQSPAATKR
jgi:hypothetical protein